LRKISVMALAAGKPMDIGDSTWWKILWLCKLPALEVGTWTDSARHQAGTKSTKCHWFHASLLNTKVEKGAFGEEQRKIIETTTASR